ncbi:MAG: hypothetical protein SNJ70_04145 [Armatimonadota bacterium]
MGPLDQILGMIPGFGGLNKLKDVKVDENQLKHVEAILLSMTKEERADPSILNASRRRRIANGSGTTVTDVNKVIKQFEDMKKMIRMMTGSLDSKGKKKKRMLNFPF